MIHWRTLAGKNGNTILYHKNTIISENQHSFHVIRSSFTVNRSSSLSTNWHTTRYAVQGQPDNLFRNTCFIWIFGGTHLYFAADTTTLYTLHTTLYTLHTTHYTLNRHPSTINRSSAAFFSINQIIIWSLKTNHLSLLLKIRHRENIHREKV